jgi:hypothetical protein
MCDCMWGSSVAAYNDQEERENPPSLPAATTGWLAVTSPTGFLLPPIINPENSGKFAGEVFTES